MPWNQIANIRGPQGIQGDPGTPGSSFIDDAIVNGETGRSPSQNAVFDALALKAPLASPALTGTPTAPTAAPGTNTTQIATTAHVLAAINALINGAPGALDTIDELAAAMADDANFATTMTNALALKAALASPTFTGTVTTPRLITPPVALTDAVTVAVNAALGNVFELTLTADRALGVPTNPTDGQIISILVTASGGDRKLTPSTAAGGYDMGDFTGTYALIRSGEKRTLVFQYEATAAKWYLIGRFPSMATTGPYVPASYTSWTNQTTTVRTIATIAVPDPGFPYWVRVQAGVEQRQLTAGRSRIALRVGSATGTEIAVSPFHDRVNQYEQVNLTSTQNAVLTGAQTLYLVGYRESGTGAHDYSNFQAFCRVWCVPDNQEGI